MKLFYPKVLAQLIKCQNCYADCHDQGSNPDTSTCVCEFIMALPFRLSTKEKNEVILLNFFFVPSIR